jgi:hypothetical protein
VLNTEKNEARPSASCRTLAEVEAVKSLMEELADAEDPIAAFRRDVVDTAFRLARERG